MDMMVYDESPFWLPPIMDNRTWYTVNELIVYVIWVHGCALLVKW